MITPAGLNIAPGEWGKLVCLKSYEEPVDCIVTRRRREGNDFESIRRSYFQVLSQLSSLGITFMEAANCPKPSCHGALLCIPELSPGSWHGIWDTGSVEVCSLQQSQSLPAEQDYILPLILTEPQRETGSMDHKPTSTAPVTEKVVESKGAALAD